MGEITTEQWILLLELRESQDHGAFAVACDGKLRRANAHALEKLTYARWCGTNWGSSFYAITDAGRAFITATPSETIVGKVGTAFHGEGGMSERADYVGLAEIARRMGVGINSGRRALQQMRRHPKFPPRSFGGKYYWPSVRDFLDLWNNRTIDAPGISAGQEHNHGQTTNSGRPRPRLAAAKERLGRDLAGYQEGLQTCDAADHRVRSSADHRRRD